MKNKAVLCASIIICIVFSIISCSEGLLGSIDHFREQAAEENSNGITVQTLTVTFDSNGATSGKVPDPQPVVAGSGFNLPSGAGLERNTEEEYFNGWNTQDDGNGASFQGGSFYTPTSDMTLFAQWDSKTKHTVSFLSNGGSSVDSQLVSEGRKAAEPTPAPTRTGYNLIGWFYNDNQSLQYDFSTLVTQDISLIAKWDYITYTIRYNGTYEGSYIQQGHISGTMMDSTFTYGTNNTLRTKPSGFRCRSHNFLGWSTQQGDTSIMYGDGGTVTTNLASTQGAIVNLYAVWQLITNCVNVAQTPSLNDQITWLKANCIPGVEYTITATVDQNINPTGTFDYTDFTLTLRSDTMTRRTITLSGSGNMFNVNYKLILEDYITLVGSLSNNTSLIRVDGGQLEMKGGCIITGNSTSFSQGISVNEYGGGVSITNGGIFTMSGGTISDNTAYGGNGVYVTGNGSKFTMSSGTITNPAYTTSGGGVYVNSNGSFTMNGSMAVISGNYAFRGGGVFVNNYGSYTMNDGIISDNNSCGGGGVYVTGYGNFTMNGGNIRNNSADNIYYGGGVSVYSGTFTMSGGTISSNTAGGGGGGVYVGNYGGFTMNSNSSNAVISTNTAGASGGGVYIESDSSFTMTGGEILKNTATTYGGGVYIGSSGSFTKNGGAIFGYVGDTVSGNVVMVSGTPTNGRGHAVYVRKPDLSFYYRDKLSYLWDNLDSSIEGEAGGWEN